MGIPRRLQNQRTFDIDAQIGQRVGSKTKDEPSQHDLILERAEAPINEGGPLAGRRGGAGRKDTLCNILWRATGRVQLLYE